MRVFNLARKPLRLLQILSRRVVTQRPVAHDDSLRAGRYVESSRFIASTPWSSYVRP